MKNKIILSFRLARNLSLGLISLLVIASANLTFAVTDLSPVQTQRWNTYHYKWTLAASQTQTGDSAYKATSVEFCSGAKTIFFKASGGTVNISFNIIGGTDSSTVITMSEAGTKTYTSWDNYETIYVTSTITSGQVDSIILACTSE